MKQYASILLLTVFCFSVLRPLYPYVDYYMNYDYIANVLCINKEKPQMQCNGKCHLTQELSKANQTNNPKDATLPHIEFDKFPIICQTFNGITFLVASEESQNTIGYSFSIQKNSLQPDTPPPRV